MIRVVFDTNVLFSAAFKRTGTPATVLDLVTRGILTPCLSDAILDEYRDVLARPILQPYRERTRELLVLMTKVADHVSPSEKVSVCTDPDDNCFLECALAAQAAYLITGNLRHFPKEYPRVAIVTPRQLLDTLFAESD